MRSEKREYGNTTMKKKPVNNWIIENNAEKVQDYLDTAEYIIVERRTCINLLIDIFSYHFKVGSGLSCLELGCGNGFVTSNLKMRYPDNCFTLLDGSASMVQKAKESLRGQRFRFIHSDFSSFFKDGRENERYNFIYSSMAIHHVPHNEKRDLYRDIYGALNDGGLFLSIDTVLPTDERSEDIQLVMWRDWMRKHRASLPLKDTEKFDNIPDKYRQNPENVPSGLCQQLDMLGEAGFHGADCFYKAGLFALFGGSR